MIYLQLDDVLHVAIRALGVQPEVRDHGLLESALGRPQATAFGEDAYPSIHEKAAALLHSLARNHALVDGNKRLALAATIAFYGMNGVRLTFSNDEAYELIWRALCQGGRHEFLAFALVGGGCGRLGGWRSGRLCATRGQTDIRGFGDAAGPWFVVGVPRSRIGRGQPPEQGAGCS